jgi:curved DNA-binding protein CbpA
VDRQAAQPLLIHAREIWKRGARQCAVALLNARHSETVEANQPSSQDYLELEQLLSRIESSATYYELLAIPRSSSTEDIVRAYKEALALFHVCYSATNETWAGELRARADQSLLKLTDAYTVLSNYGKRVEYDNLNSGRRTKPLKLDIPIGPAPRPEAPQPEPEPEDNQAPFIRDPQSVLVPDQDALAQGCIDARTSPFSIARKEGSAGNRRRVSRSLLSIPAYVMGHDRVEGKWREVARTRDVSRFGAALEMHKNLPQGMVLNISLPLPLKLRNHGFADAGYNTFAIVRRVGISRNGIRLVGVEFLGERPPEGYLAKPWGIFKTGPWNGPDRRRTPRQKITEPIRIEYLDELSRRIGEEVGVAENISAGGLRVRVKRAPSRFDYARIARQNDGFQSLASVCHRFVGTDRLERLCLSFISEIV